MIKCIYHGNCADGFGAAMAVYKKFGKDNVEFIKGVYQQEPPDVTDCDVIIVDFSYKRPVLLELAKKARSVIILDHHKSAEEDLRGGDGITRMEANSDCYSERVNKPGQIDALFDMNRSGAGIAWDFFFPESCRPKLINHIEDRDLWRFNLECTREISAALFSYEYEFGTWETLIDQFELDPWPLIHAGEAIERKHHKDIRELLKQTTRRAIIGGFNIPVANLPYTMSSDAGHILAKGEPFSACYFDKEKTRYFSLRSSDEGQDVSAIAKQYGGGGHRNAAGFEIPFAQAATFEINE